MNQLLKTGWAITEMRYDAWQEWYYFAATHEGTQETVESNSKNYSEALSELTRKAKENTPKWYLDQLKQRKAVKF